MSQTRYAGLASREVDGTRKGKEKEQRRQKRKEEETGQHLPGRSRRDEKDRDNMESACKERSFPGRLESTFYIQFITVFLPVAPESPVPLSVVQPLALLPRLCLLSVFSASCRFVLSKKRTDHGDWHAGLCLLQCHGPIILSLSWEGGGRTSFFSFSFFNKKGFTPQEQINHFELLINTAAVKRKMATCMQ